MPAKSEKQRRLMGMVHAYKVGKYPDAPEHIKRIAAHIKDKQAREFATKTASIGTTIPLLGAGLGLADIVNYDNKRRQLSKDLGEQQYYDSLGSKNSLKYENAYKRMLKKNNITSNADLSEYVRPWTSNFKAIYSDPKNTPLYQLKKEVWDMSKVPKDDPLRKADLDFTEHDLKGLRVGTRGMAIGVLSALLGFPKNRK